MLGLDPQVPCYRSSPVLRTSTILLRLLGHQPLGYLILSAENTAQSQELGQPVAEAHVWRQVGWQQGTGSLPWEAKAEALPAVAPGYW